MKKLLAAALLTVVFFVGVFAVMQFTFHTPITILGAEKETIASVPPETFEETGYHYARLSLIEQAAYAAIVLNVEAFPEEIEIPAISAEQLGRVANAAALDHPMLYQYDRGVALVKRSGRVYFAPRYTCTKEEYEAAKAQVDQAVQDILSQMTQGTEYENELFLHDYLVGHCRYDEEESGSNNFNPVGALVDGSAICSGYAKAFKLLLDAAGIENTPVIGKASENGGEPVAHIWNAVKLGDHWYFVDPTWDDPILSDGQIEDDYGTYNYFNITDAMISLTHSDYTFDYPCDDESLFYYRVNNAYLTEETGDVVQFAAGLIAAAGENGRSYIDFKCETDALYKAAVKKLFKDQKIYRAVNRANLKLNNKFSNRTARYSVDDANRRIIVELSEKT